MKRLVLCSKDLSNGVFASQVLPFITQDDEVCYNRTLFPQSLTLFRAIFNVLFYKYRFIYVRDPKTFIVLFIFKLIFVNKTSVHYDFRGAVAEECRYQNYSRLKTIFYSLVERLAFRYATSVSCVSQNFKKLLCEKYGSWREVQVFPSCSNVLVFNQNEIDLDFVYVGGVVKWQYFSEIISAFEFIARLRPGSTLTIITSDVESATYHVSHVSDLDISIKRLSNRELVRELENYSFGFIFRDNDIINEVSSPIKLSEYICSGLVPIYTGKLGDFTDDPVFQSISIRYDSDCIVEIDKALEDNERRAKIFEFAQSYSWRKRLFEHPFYKL